MRRSILARKVCCYCHQSIVLHEWCRRLTSLPRHHNVIPSNPLLQTPAECLASLIKFIPPNSDERFRRDLESINGVWPWHVIHDRLMPASLQPRSLPPNILNIPRTFILHQEANDRRRDLQQFSHASISSEHALAAFASSHDPDLIQAPAFKNHWSTCGTTNS